MKRLVDLTNDDLSASPVWRYEGGGGEGAVVAAVERDSLSQSDDEIFLAATEFELFDASRHAGYCFPADGTAMDYVQPVIVTPSRHVVFWFEQPPTAESLASQWAALGRGPKQIFPATFRCLVPVDGQTVRGRIAGVAFPEEPRAAAKKSADPMRRPGIGAAETRTARRRPAEMTVEFKQGALYGSGVTGDVSRRGMFVRSTWIPGAGPVVRLTVNLPGGRKLGLTGRVVRSVDAEPHAPVTPGFGLRLTADWPDWDELFGKRGSKK